MEQFSTSRELAARLGRHRDDIRDTWTRRLQERPGSHYGDRPREEIADWAARGLEAVIRSLLTGSARPLEVHARRVADIRRRLGFDIREVLKGLLLLKEVALPHLLQEAGGDLGKVARWLTDLDRCIGVLVSDFGALYAAAMRSNVAKEKDRMSQLLAAVESVGGTLDLDVVLARVARFARAATKAAFCCIFMPDDGSTTWRYRAGAGVLETGDVRDLLRKPVEPTTDPLFQRALALREAAIYRRDDVCPFLGGKTCVESDVGHAILLPITAGERTLGVALVLAPADAKTVNPERVELAAGIASVVGPALENARLYAQSRRTLSETVVLQQISSALLEETALQSMLEYVCRQSQRLTGASGASILLYETGGGLRKPIRVGDMADSADDLAFEAMCAPEGDTPVEPVVFNDLPEKPSDGSREHHPRGLAAVPLRVGGKLVGLLQIVNRTGEFDEEDLRLLARIADQAAIAVHHAVLHDRQERMAVVEERQRVARELHDSVTQSIYGTVMFAEAAGRLLDRGDLSAARQHLNELRDASLKALWEMRLLIFELRPLELEKRGLVSALQSRLSTVENRAGLKAEFRCEGIGRLPHRIEDALYRIAQEALNNAIKHANASRVSLSLTRSESTVELVFRDNGVGFDLDAGRQKEGFGLAGMEQRTAGVGGELKITTGRGHGTRVEVRVPISSETEAEASIMEGTVLPVD
jgi:signal transduction histidine kinase